jgi:hypothetical protein
MPRSDGPRHLTFRWSHRGSVRGAG